MKTIKGSFFKLRSTSSINHFKIKQKLLKKLKETFLTYLKKLSQSTKQSKVGFLARYKWATK